MTTHDINHTCKHGFTDFYLLSRICNYILIVMIFSAFPFDVDFVIIFKVMSW